MMWAVLIGATVPIRKPLSRSFSSSAIWRQLRVPNRVLDIPVAEIRLQRPSVVAAIGQGESASMSEHVRMHLDLKLGSLCGSFQHPGKAGSGERRAAL